MLIRFLLISGAKKSTQATEYHYLSHEDLGGQQDVKEIGWHKRLPMDFLINSSIYQAIDARLCVERFAKSSCDKLRVDTYTNNADEGERLQRSHR